MTSVFIVRPFGKKSATVKDKDGNKKSVEVDFDQIHKSLIQAAIEKNGLECSTTEVIAKAGNIRFDMFQMLIAYDLVIADISIHNANVFYELGIRHGLRPQGTILLRFPTAGDDVPFDLKTDRYIAYDWEKPAAAVDALTRSIKDTIDAMRRADRKADSPVFLLLPALKAPDLDKLIVVPKEFQEAVEKAEANAATGRATLALLGEEAKRNSWAREGVRLVARAQRRTRTLDAARESWEFIRKDLADDVEANLQLATIYQRLGDLVAASQACQRVLDNGSARRQDRADARSQLARNEKALWVADFNRAATETERRQRAISDNRLILAFEGYLEGFKEDQNDYYSGINALGLLKAIVLLAEAEPAAWAGTFPTGKKAEFALGDYQDQLAVVRGAVQMSIDNAKQQARRTGKPDEWLPASDAQYRLLTVETPAYVRSAYQSARKDGGASLSVESEARQVAIFHRLGLLSANCRAAIEGLGLTPADLEPGEAPKQAASRDRVIVATGHRADAPGRSSPRFPNTPESIAKARAWLREAVQKEKAQTTGALSAIAGAASGTDLLFHEVCAELGIPAKVVLPIPAEAYRRESVKDGGPEWMEMFNKLVARDPRPIVLSDSDEPPIWTREIKPYSVFQRGNIWMMEDALLQANADVTLLALWNGKAGDGPGGTADMIALAESHGAKTCVADSNKLFGL